MNTMTPEKITELAQFRMAARPGTKYRLNPERAIAEAADALIAKAKAKEDEIERAEILRALDRMVSSRPGFDFANYGDRASYMADLRPVTRDLEIARTLMLAVEWRSSSIDADAMKAELRSGSRLSWDSDKRELSYCAGQYYPVEYRAAACRALASMLWTAKQEGYPNLDGHGLRAAFRREFGRGIANRYFN